TPSAVQELLADALGDSTITLALWDGVSGYVDVDGEPVELPIDPQARGVTLLHQDTLPVAALIHDPMLDTDSALVEGLAASSLIMLENSRLVAERQASRTRIVETVALERRRLERDLHDGAQQKLVAASLNLSLANELPNGDPELNKRLADARVQLEQALAELREVAHGIYPVALGRYGLFGAFDLLAARTPNVVCIPSVVSRAESTVARPPAAVEVALYYVGSEAVQNALKHAGANARVSIRLYSHAESFRLEVSDDGLGFDVERVDNGAGLQNMRDRVSAVDGHLSITSVPDRGTLVTAAVPIPDVGSIAEPDHSLEAARSTLAG